MPEYNPAGGVDNDGRFPDDSTVAVRYPGTPEPENWPPGGPPRHSQADRESWPWLPGTIMAQCGPGEWRVCVEVRELAQLEDGSAAPEGTPDEDLFYPVCFRDASELRSVEQGAVDLVATWQATQLQHDHGAGI
jgi:hypothetical protein